MTIILFVLSISDFKQIKHDVFISAFPCPLHVYVVKFSVRDC